VNSQAKILSDESDGQPSSARDSRASPTVLQENVLRLVMNVISPGNLKESFGRLNPDGSLLRTSRGYAQANLDGFLESSCMTFPRWGILSDGVVGELRMSEPAIEENGSLLLPTLNTCDATMGQLKGKEYTGNRHALKLEQAINLIPTLTCNTGKNTSPGINFDKREAKCHLDGVFMNQVGKKTGLQLQPAFAEWMMGFPIGYTDLLPSEMPLSRSKSIWSSKQSQTTKKEGVEP